MKTSVTLFQLILLSTLSFGQVLNFNLGRHIDEFDQLEDSLSSENWLNKNTHILANGTAQPMSFLRTSDNLEPQPIVRYTFRLSDSTVQEIQYEWDKTNFRERNHRMTENDIETNEQLQLMTHKYIELQKEINALLGRASESTGSLKPKNGLDYLNVDVRDSWKNDSISVLMYMTFTNRYEVMGNATFAPAHRIRVYIKSKQDIHGNPSDQFKTIFKVDSKQGEIAEKYIGLLLANKLKSSWKLLSPENRSQTTYKIYLKDMEFIFDLKKKFGNEIVLSLSGPKFGKEGAYYSYSFTFKEDTSIPPSVFLDVTFKLGDEVITAFQPKKLGRRKE